MEDLFPLLLYLGMLGLKWLCMHSWLNLINFYLPRQTILTHNFQKLTHPWRTYAWNDPPSSIKKKWPDHDAPFLGVKRCVIITLTAALSLTHNSLVIGSLLLHMCIAQWVKILFFIQNTFFSPKNTANHFERLAYLHSWLWGYLFITRRHIAIVVLQKVFQFWVYRVT